MTLIVTVSTVPSVHPAIHLSAVTTVIVYSSLLATVAINAIAINANLITSCLKKRFETLVINPIRQYILYTNMVKFGE